MLRMSIKEKWILWCSLVQLHCDNGFAVNTPRTKLHYVCFLKKLVFTIINKIMWVTTVAYFTKFM